MIIISALFVALCVATYIIASVFDALNTLDNPQLDGRRLKRSRLKADILIDGVRRPSDLEATLSSLSRLKNKLGDIVVLVPSKSYKAADIRKAYTQYPGLNVVVRPKDEPYKFSSQYTVKLDSGMMLDESMFITGLELLKRDRALGVIYPATVQNRSKSISYIFAEYLLALRQHYWKFIKVIAPRKSFHPGFYRSSCLDGSDARHELKQQLDSGLVFRIQGKDSLVGLLQDAASSNLSKMGDIISQRMLWPLAGIYLLSSISLPILVTYLIYLALILHEPAMLMLTWALLSVFLLLSIWGESVRPFGDRLRLSLLIPASLPLFYVLVISNLLAVIRCIIWPEFMGPEYLRSDTELIEGT